MLPENDGNAVGLPINSYYWKKGMFGPGLYKNTDEGDDDYDLQIEGIDIARKGRVNSRYHADDQRRLYIGDFLG